MIDLGEKPGTLETPKRRTYYPTIHIDDKDLPFEDGEVGKTFDAKVKIKLTEISTRDTEGSDKKTFDFEVRKIEFQKDMKAEDYIRARAKRRRIKENG